MILRNMKTLQKMCRRSLSELINFLCQFCLVLFCYKYLWRIDLLSKNINFQTEISTFLKIYNPKVWISIRSIERVWLAFSFIRHLKTINKTTSFFSPTSNLLIDSLSHRERERDLVKLRNLETSKSLISAKPSALIIEGLEADFFTPTAWKKWKTEGLEEKNHDFMPGRNGLLTSFFSCRKRKKRNFVLIDFNLPKFRFSTNTVNNFKNKTMLFNFNMFRYSLVYHHQNKMRTWYQCLYTRNVTTYKIASKR